MLRYNKVRVLFLSWPPLQALFISSVDLHLFVSSIDIVSTPLLAAIWLLSFSFLIASVLDHSDRYRPTTRKIALDFISSVVLHDTATGHRLPSTPRLRFSLYSALLNSSILFILLYFFFMLAHVCLVHFESRRRLRPFCLALLITAPSEPAVRLFIFVFCDHLEHSTGVWFRSSVKISSALRIQSLSFQFPISTIVPSPLFWCFALQLHDHIPPDFRLFLVCLTLLVKLIVVKKCFCFLLPLSSVWEERTRLRCSLEVDQEFGRCVGMSSTVADCAMYIHECNSINYEQFAFSNIRVVVL